MPRIELSFLGTFEARLDGEPIKEFESSKVRALLAYLVMEADKPHSRDRLAGMFWGETNDETASKNLRQALSNLRKSIHDDRTDRPLLTITSATVQINPDADLWLDMREFESLLAACEAHPHRKLETCTACAQRKNKALSLVRGSFLEGFFLKEADAFQDWIVVWRERFHQQTVDVLCDLIFHHQRRGEIKPAIALAQRLVSLDPWREEAHTILMELLFRDGQRSAALKQYETCRNVLMKELGVEPQAETILLYENIREKKLSATESHIAPNNLPTELTSFIGRERELSQLADRIQRTDARLVTLTGLGGAGKTRLALQAARGQLFSFSDGVFFVSLGNIVHASALPQAIAEALGFTFASSGEPRTQLLNYLRQKEILLVLDNFEHVLDGAGFVADLLHAAPDLNIIATSRQPLQIQAEWLLELGGLLVHPQDGKNTLQSDVSTSLGTNPAPAPVFSEAARLFVERAQRVSSTFSISPSDYPHILRLCQLLDGLPLGIELAAAWTRQLTPAQIAERVERDLDFLASNLRDAPERHRSLRVAFDQSWDMLSEAEKEAFASLSIFPAAFQRETADEICRADSEMLNQLWRKSLVLQRSPEHYSLHPLLKQYGREKLDGGSFSVINQRFQDHHAALAARLASQLHSAELKQGLENFTSELDNLTEAWRLALAEVRLETLNALLAPLFWYYEIKGRIYDGHLLFQNAAQFLAERKRPKRAEVKLARRLNAYLAWLCFRRAEANEAVTRFETLAANGLDSLDGNERVFVMAHFASVIFEQGRKDEALRWFDAALVLSAQVHVPWEQALAYNHYGAEWNMLGDLDRAEKNLQRSLQIADEHGYAWVSASAFTNMAVNAYFRGDYRAAITMFTQSNAKALEYGDEHHSASINHNNLADCYLSLGELQQAREHLNLALYHFNECGNTIYLPYVYNTLAGVNIQDGKLTEAKKYLDLGIKCALEHDMFSALNNLLADTAHYYFLLGDGTRSAVILNYVLESADTIKEGMDKAVKLKSEITQIFGAGVWEQADASSPLTRASMIELLGN